MATNYEISIMRKTKETDEQTDYDIVAKVMIVDGDKESDDRWFMMPGSRGTIEPGEGTWWLSSSYNRLVLLGAVQGGSRVEAGLDYQSWPVKVGQMGKFTSRVMIRPYDMTLEYTFLVERVT